jgi:hypothetical protein
MDQHLKIVKISRTQPDPFRDLSKVRPSGARFFNAFREEQTNCLVMGQSSASEEIHHECGH